ncbi:GNAT family N-acetyltransferase, partial [Aureimonas pseudogalii]
MSPLVDKEASMNGTTTTLGHVDLSTAATSSETLEADGLLTSKLRIVRITTREGILRAIEIGREFHAESRYGYIPFSEAKFVRAYERLLTRPDTTLGVIVERKGEIVGVMGAEIGDYFLGTGCPIATNYFIYVSGKLRRTVLGGRIALKLMRLFIDWAKANGAHELNVHVTSGIHPAQTDKFM